MDMVWRRRPSRMPYRGHPAVLQGKPVGRDDIQAALRNAADSIAHEVIVLRVPGPKR